jgi:SAM-dependent methyltransferase
MSAEFTGERVIPGQVDVNLWNEHLARYAFAARLCRNRRVLDVGSGTGYGAAALGANAALIAGMDIASDALAYSREHYSARNLRWVQASCLDVPFRDGSFDLVLAFEVIEHLTEWQKFLEEARRVLAPGGQFIVSTPNRLFYAETRRLSGPNPFHEHEFEYEEFHAALKAVFPHVSLFLEDHTEGILFKSVGSRGAADVRLEGHEQAPQEANFFVAVCAMTPQTGSPTFVYLPSSANLLRERGLHIQRLEGELRTKDEWLAETKGEHQKLVAMFREQTTELEQRNAWAERLDAQVKASGKRIEALQKELADEQAASKAVARGYEEKVAELEQDVAQKTRWAEETELRLGTELAAKCAELALCVELLQRAETTVEERTNWALQLDSQRLELEAKLSMVEASRWVRLGRTFGIGPALREQ